MAATDGVDGQAPKMTRPSFEEDVDMPDAPPLEFQKWRDWRQSTYAIATAFISPEDCGAPAAAYQTCIPYPLSMASVDLLCIWDVAHLNCRPLLPNFIHIPPIFPTHALG